MNAFDLPREDLPLDSLGRPHCPRCDFLLREGSKHEVDGLMCTAWRKGGESHYANLPEEARMAEEARMRRGR